MIIGDDLTVQLNEILLNLHLQFEEEKIAVFLSFSHDRKRTDIFFTLDSGL